MLSLRELQDALTKEDKTGPTFILPDPGVLPKASTLWHSNKDSFDESEIRAILFWSAMYKDHCIFIQSSLAPETKSDYSHNVEIVNDNLQLPHDEKVKPLRRAAAEVKGIKEAAKILEQQWREFEDSAADYFLQTGNQRNVMPLFCKLWNDTYQMKKSILHLVKDQKLWIGDIDESFALGMLAELYYTRARLEGKLFPWQEVALFMDDVALHLALTAQHLDAGVSNKTLRAITRKILDRSEQVFELRDDVASAKKFAAKHLSQALTFLKETQKTFETVVYSGKEPPSKAHPLIARHAIAEAIFEIERLQELKKLNGKFKGNQSKMMPTRKYPPLKAEAKSRSRKSQSQKRKAGKKKK